MSRGIINRDHDEVAMHAFTAFAPGLENCRHAEVPDVQPKDGQVLVQLKASALNHLDLWIARGEAFGKVVLTR